MWYLNFPLPISKKNLFGINECLITRENLWTYVTLLVFKVTFKTVNGYRIEDIKYKTARTSWILECI